MKAVAERTQLLESRKKESPPPVRLWVRDSWVEYPVGQVPVDALVLNADNRRFAAQRRLIEDQLGRALDPENYPDDERALEVVLLDSSFDVRDGRVFGGNPSPDYEALRLDWLRREQESPFWIRPDGTVSNGNRRLAMILREQRASGAEGLQYVDAVILDWEDIDEQALFDMEQREQLTENFKVRYDDINLLLAIKESAEARGIDWWDADSIDDVAGELQTLVEKTKAEVVRDLNAIKYMNQFLEEAGQPGQYYKLMRTLERFRDIGRTMPAVEAAYPEEADKVLRLMFAAVRANKPHQDIRALRHMFRDDRERFDRLYEQVVEREDVWEESHEGQALADPDPTIEVVADDDDDYEEETIGPRVIDYPTDEIGGAISLAIDAFGASKRQDAMVTLREILNRLELLDDDRHQLRAAVEGDEGEEVRRLFEKLMAWVDEHRSLLE